MILTEVSCQMYGRDHVHFFKDEFYPMKYNIKKRIKEMCKTAEIKYIIHYKCSILNFKQYINNKNETNEK